MSYLRKNLIAICLILFSSVMLFYGCDKNEYKKLKLEVSSSELEIVLDENSPENNLFSITATVSGMPKGYDGAVSFSVPVNDFISPVVTNPEVRDEGRSTGIFEAKKQGGPVTITVTTLEGNLTKNITVKVVKPITAISFNTLTIPVVKGVKTDMSQFLTFNPDGTNQTDVKLELVSSTNSDKLIQVVTDGKYLTVPTDLDLSEFQLRVRSAVNEEVVTQTLANVKVVTVVPVENIVLMHNNETPDFTEDDLAVSKNSNNEYSIVLATNTGTLYTKTVYFNFNNDSNENNNYTVTVKGLTESGAIIEDDGQENRFVEVDKHTTIKNGFNINARGNGNTKIQFVIDRTDFPGYFTQTITLNISVQAYPTEISVNNGSNENKLDKIQLYANYDETTTFGTPIRIVVSNETGVMTDQKVIASLNNGAENITLYDSNKNIVSWGTELIAGARYYLKHNFETAPSNDITLSLISVTYNQIFLNVPINIETQQINLTTTTPQINVDVTKPELKTTLIINGLPVNTDYRELVIDKLSNCEIIKIEQSSSQITISPATTEIGECLLKVSAPNGSSITFTIILYEQLITNNTSITIAGTVISAKDMIGEQTPEINIKNGLNIQVYFNINGKEFSSLNNTGLIYHAVTSNSQVVQTKSNVYQLQTQNMAGSAHIQIQIVGFNEFGEQTKAVYFEIDINVSVPLTSLIANQNETILYDTNSLSASQVAEYGTYTIVLSSSPFNASFTWEDVEWICEYNGGQLRSYKIEREDNDTIDYTFQTSSYDIITLTTTKSNFKQATITCQIASSTTSVITFNIVAKVNQEFTNENGLVISSPKSISVRFLVYKAQRVTDFVFENISSKGTSTQPVFELTYDERDLEYNGSVYTNTANCIKTINFSVYPSNALNKNLGVVASSSVIKATVNNVLKTLTIQLLSKPTSTSNITLTVYAEDDVNNGVIGNNKIIQIRILDGSSERSAFEIKNEEELKKINSSLSSYYVLASDVALSNEWTPIGLTSTSVQQFNGNLSGKYVVYDENDIVVTTSYYSITGLYINNNTYDYYGLFAYLGQTAKIKDLTINSFSIKANITHDKNVFVGALAGYSEGEITNVSVNDQSGVQSFNGLYYENASTGTTSTGIYITAETNTNVHANYFVGGLVGFVNNSLLYTSNTADVDATGSNVFNGLRTNYKLVGSTAEYLNTQVVNSKATVQMNVYVKTNNTSFVGGLVGFNNRAVITSTSGSEALYGSSSAHVVTAINANLSPQQTAFNNHSSFGGVVGFNNGIVENIIAKASIFGVYENSADYYNIKNVGGIVGYNVGTVKDNTSFPLLQGYINVGGVVGKSISAVVTLKGTVNSTDYSFNNGKMAIGDGLFTMINSLEFNKYFRIELKEFESVSFTYDEFVDVLTSQYSQTAAEDIVDNVYEGKVAETYSAIKVTTLDMFDGEKAVVYAYANNSYFSVANINDFDSQLTSNIALQLAGYGTNTITGNSVQFLQLNDNVKLYNSAIVGFNNIGGLIGEYVGVVATPSKSYKTVNDDTILLNYINFNGITYNTVYNYSLKAVEQKSGTMGTGYYGNILLSNAHYYQVSAQNRNYAGGLVGKMTNGALHANQVFASIQGELAGLGGLIGKAEGITNISNSSFVGVIINRDSAQTEEVKPATGGLVGDALDVVTTFSHSGVADKTTGEESYRFVTGLLWVYEVDAFGVGHWVAGDHNNIASSYFRAKDLNGDYIQTYTDETIENYEYIKSIGYVGDGNKELDYTYYYSDGSGVKEYVVDGVTYTTKKVNVDTLAANESSCSDCNPSFNFAGDTINEDDLAEFISNNKAYAAYGSDLNGDGLLDADTGEDYANKTLDEFKSTYLNNTYWYVNEQINDGLPVMLSKNKLEATGEKSYKISLLANFPPTDIILENKQNFVDTFIANLDDNLANVIYYYGLDSSNYKEGGTLNFTSTSTAEKISVSTAELNAQLAKYNTYSLSEIFNLSSIPKFINGNSFNISSSNSSVLSVELDKQNNVKFVAKSAGYAVVTITSNYNVALTKSVYINVANATTNLNLGYFASGEQKYIQENQVIVINKSTEDNVITLPISSNFSATHTFNGISYPEVSESFKLTTNQNSGVRYYYSTTRTLVSGGATNTYSSIYYATNDIESVIDGIQLSINGSKFSYELIGTIEVSGVATNYYTIFIDVPYGTTANFVGLSETEQDITLIAVPYLIATTTEGKNKIVLANLGGYDDSMVLSDETIMGLVVPSEESIVLDNSRFGVEDYTYSQYELNYLNNLQNLITKFNVRISKATWNLTNTTDSITFDVKTAPSFEIEIETDKDDEELYLSYYQVYSSSSIERKISYSTMFSKYNGEVKVGNITLRANNKTITSIGNKNYIKFSFTVLVKDEDKNNVQDEISTTFKFFVVKQDAVLDVENSTGIINNAISSVVASGMLNELPVTLLPQSITEITLKHYPNSESKTSTDANGNKITEVNLNEIAYDNIIPGNVGVLKAYISPYYASFDELHIVSSTSSGDVVLFEQLLARTIETSGGIIYNGLYETLITANDQITNGIKLQKISTINQNNEQLYDGNIYIRTLVSSFATEADTFTLTLRAYKNGTLVKEQSITLDVQTPPSLNLTVNGDEAAPIARGTEITFEANLRDINGTIDFSSSYMYRINSNGVEVKVGALNADFAIKNNGGNYSVSVNNNVASDRYIKVVGTVTKEINGETITHTDYITLHVTDFVIEEISVDKVTNGNFVGMFNQPYALIVKISKATYNSANADVVKERIKQLEAEFSAYSESQDTLTTWKLVNTLASSGSASRYGSLRLGYNGNDSFIVNARIDSTLGNVPVYTIQNTKFGSGDKLAAVIQYVYTDSGIVPLMTDDDRLLYSSSAYFYEKTFEFGFGFYRVRDEERPDPIETAEQFAAMEDGVDYILVNDITLTDWTPFSEDLKINSLDGNGYVITIESFNLDSYTDDASLIDNANIGIFSKINAGTTIKNLIIEVKSKQNSVSVELATYDNSAVDLYVDARAYKNINFGLLAGQNAGIVTNCQVVYDANSLRRERELIIAKEYFLTDVKYKDYASLDAFKTELNTKYADVTNRQLSVVRIETTTTVEIQTHYMAGLIGLNLDEGTDALGYITNSSVENVTINGVGYVAGFVASNAGKISSSYFKGANIINRVAENYSEAATGGFVVINSGTNAAIQYSYIQGRLGEGNAYANPSNGGTLTNGDKTGLTAENKAGFAGYKYANTSGNNVNIVRLRALNALITTKTNASAFVYENDAIVSNSYANIIVNSSMSTSGFVFTNKASGTISSCYSLSSVKTNSWDASPFTGRSATHDYNNENPNGIQNCHYLKLGSDENSTTLEIELAEDYLDDNEPATSLGSSQFGEYNTFQSYAFNTDFELSSLDNVTRAVWFIPNATSSEYNSEYFKNDYYVYSRPELVAANLKTISIRVWVGSETSEENSYTYASTAIGESVQNPLLVKTAEDFNRYLNYESTVDDSERNFAIRFISDVTFNKTDLTAQTYNMDYYGDLDGNGMSINELRLVSDTDFENEKTGETITHLGLFGRIITKDYGEETAQRGVVRNININVSEVRGSKVTYVGALAGSIENADVFNVTISGDEVIQGKNIVGGLAGIIKGDSEIVNITSSLSAKAAYFKETNRFSTTIPNELPDVYGTFNLYVSELQGEEVSNADVVSYAGGIAGIFDVTARDEEEGMNPLSLFNAKARSLQVTGDVTIIGEVVGGIFGLNGVESTTSDLSFIVAENTAPELRGSRIVGGLVGENRGEIERSYIAHESTLQEKIDESYKNSISSGNYTNSTLNYNGLYSSNAHYTGGLVGFNNDGKITNAYAKINVINLNSMYVGGFVGLSIGGEYNFCYTIATVVGFRSAGGFIGIQSVNPYTVETVGTGEDKKIVYTFNSEYMEYFYFQNSEQSINVTLEDGNKQAFTFNNASIIGSGASKLVGIVSANIWRSEDLITNRATLYGAADLKIGAIIGVAVLPEVDNQYQLSEVIDVGDLTSRKKNETIFFIQPYITSLRHNSNYTGYLKLMPEVGAYQDDYGFIYNQKSLTRDYRFSIATDSVTNGDTYDEAAYGTDEIDEMTRPQGLSGYVVEPKRNEYNQYIKNGSAGSGSYTADEADKNYYRYSRMQNIGSARTLKEIITTLDVIETEATKMGDSKGSITLGTYDDVVNTPIFNTWNTYRWTGVRKETNADQNTVFPYLEAKPEKTRIFVYSVSDLELMSSYVNAEFILMNDINLTEDNSSYSWTPVGTKAIPFKGIIRSNTYEEGGVTLSRQYTIYNVNIKSAQGSYAGLVGYATEAEFKNFNLSTVNLDPDDQDGTPLFIGALIGYATGGTIIDNVDIVNTVASAPSGSTLYGVKIKTSNAGSVGGLVGYNETGVISNSNVADIDIKINGIGDLSRLESERNKTLAFGGLVGYMTSAEPGVPMVSASSTQGSITIGTTSTALSIPSNDTFVGSTGYSFDIGGVIGRSNNSDSEQARVVNVSSKTIIYANVNNNGGANVESVNVGGLIGKSQNTLLTQDQTIDETTLLTTAIHANKVIGTGSNDINVVVSGLGSTSSTKNATLNIGGAVGSIYARDSAVDATFVTDSFAYTYVGHTTQLKIVAKIVNSAYLTSNIGGAVGYSENAIISNIYANANIAFTDSNVGNSTNGSIIYAGGLAGRVVNGQNISNIASFGSLTINNDQTNVKKNSVVVGGAFGEVYLTEVDSKLQTISRGVAQTSVTINMGAYTNNGTCIVGGFVGRIYGGGIAESISGGNVVLQNAKYNKQNFAGGFVGYINMEDSQIPKSATDTTPQLPNIINLANNYSTCDMQLTLIFESSSSSYAGLFAGHIYYGYSGTLKHLTLKNNFTIGKFIYTQGSSTYFDSLYLERSNKGGFLGGFSYPTASSVNSTNVERASNLVFVNNYYNSDFIPYTNGYMEGLTTSQMLYTASTTFTNYKTETITNYAGDEESVWVVQNNRYPTLNWINQSSDSVNESTGAVNYAKLTYSVCGKTVSNLQLIGTKIYPTTTIDASLTEQAYIANSTTALANLNGKTLTNKTIYIKDSSTNFNGKTITSIDEHSLINGLNVTDSTATSVTTNNGMLVNSSIVKNLVGTNNGVVYRVTFAGTNLANTVVTTNKGAIDTMVAEDTSTSQTSVNLVTTNSGVIYRSMIKNTKVSFASTLGTIKSSYYLSTADSKTVANYFNQMGSAYSYDIYGTNVDFDLAEMEGNILSSDGFDFANDWILIEPSSSANATTKLTLNYGAPILRYELYGANSTRGGYNFDGEIESSYYWTNTGQSFNNLIIKYANLLSVEIGGTTPEVQMAEIAQATSVGEVVSGYPVSELETTATNKALYNNASSFDKQTITLSGTNYLYTEVETTEYVYGVKTITKRKLLNFENTAIYLTKDVDLGGKLWTPIGFGFDNLQVNVGDVITNINSSNHNVFMGTFNGSGYVVSNVTSVEANKNVGLFGTIYAKTSSTDGSQNPVFGNVVIRNSNFISVSQNGGFALAGALAGRVILDANYSQLYVLSKVGTEHANVFATNRASGLIGDYLSLSSKDTQSSTIEKGRFITTIMNYAYVNSDVVVSKGDGNYASGFVNYGNNNHYNQSHTLVPISTNNSGNNASLGLKQLYFAGNLGDYRLNSNGDYKFVNQHTDLSSGYSAENCRTVESLYGLVGNILTTSDSCKDNVYAINLYDSDVMNESGKITAEYLASEAIPKFDWGTIWTRLSGQNDDYPVLVSKVGYWVEDVKASGFVAPSYDITTKTYSIANASQLAWVANQVNLATSNADTEKTFSGYTVKLTANINLSGKIWSSIGYRISSTDYRAFAGTFDFNGKTISGMTASGVYINKDDYTTDVSKEEEYVNVVCITSKSVGLFGCTSNATIKGTDVSTTTVSGLVVANGAYAGGVVAYANNTTIFDITSNVVVKSTGATLSTGDYATGGVVGTFKCDTSITLTNLTYSGNISSTANNVGGIVGCISDESTGDIKLVSCRNTADITAENNQNIGGIIGLVQYTSSSKYAKGNILINGIDNYVSDASATSDSKYYKTSSTPDNTGTIKGRRNVGGIVGNMSTGNIEAVTNTGTIVATQEIAGGIVGDIDRKNTNSTSGIYEAVNVGNVLADKNTGGIAGKVSSTAVTLVNLLNRGFVNRYSSYVDTEPPATLTGVSNVGSIVGYLSGGIDNHIGRIYSVIDATTAEQTHYMFGTSVKTPGLLDLSKNTYLDHAIINIWPTQSPAIGACKIKQYKITDADFSVYDIFNQSLVWRGVNTDVSKFEIYLKYNNKPGGDEPIFESGAYQVKNQYNLIYLKDLNKKRYGVPSISSDQLIKIANNFTINNSDATQMGSTAYTWSNDVEGATGVKITLSVAKDLFGIVKGVKDGGDVKISNFSLIASSNETGGLLMANGDYVAIDNIDIESCTISASTTTFGGLAKDLKRSTINNSDSSAVINGGSSTTTIGGLVATTNNVTITNSSNTGSISVTASDNTYIGGIVGTSNGTTKFESSTVGAAVEKTSGGNTVFDYRKGKLSGARYIGGIIAQTASGDYLKGCISTTNILAGSHTYSSSSDDSSVAGGIVAEANGSGNVIESCENSSIVKARIAGGIAGESSVNIINSTNKDLGEVIGYVNAGGIVGKAANSITITGSKSIGYVASNEISRSKYVGGIIGDSNGQTTINNPIVGGYVGVWSRWVESGSYGTNWYYSTINIDSDNGTSSSSYKASDYDNGSVKGKYGYYSTYYYSIVSGSSNSSISGLLYDSGSTLQMVYLYDYYVKFSKSEWSSGFAWCIKNVSFSAQLYVSSGTAYGDGKAIQSGGFAIANVLNDVAVDGSSDSDSASDDWWTWPDQSKITIETKGFTIENDTDDFPANSDTPVFYVQLDYNNSNKINPDARKYFEGSKLILPSASDTGLSLVGWYTSKNTVDKAETSSLSGTKIEAGTIVNETNFTFTTVTVSGQTRKQVTLYAYWETVRVNVVLYGKGGVYSDAYEPALDKDLDTEDTESEEFKNKQAKYTAKQNESYVGTVTPKYNQGLASDKDNVSSFNANGTITFINSSINNNLTRSGYLAKGWYTVSVEKWNKLVDNANLGITYQDVRNSARETLQELMGYDTDGEEWKDAKQVVNNVISGTGYEKCQVTSSTKFTSNTSYIFVYWVPVQTVTFNLNYTGSTNETVTVEQGSTVSKIANPTRVGYQFDNWYTDSSCTNLYNFSDPVTTDLTLYAKWIGNDVNVTFRYYNNEISAYEIMKSITVKNGESIKAADIPSVTREGYDFVGWYKGSAASELVSSSSVFTYTLDMGNATELIFTAKYEPQEFTLNFYEDAGGTAISTQTIEYNGTATEVSVTDREGYSFMGWYTSTDGGVTLDDLFTFSTLVKSDMELYAMWGVKQVLLTFKVNVSGSWQVYESLQVNYGEVVTTLPTDPTQEGDYRFAGWCLDEGLTNVVDFTTYTPLDDVELYALFKEQVTVTFVDNTSTEIGSIAIDKNSSFTIEQLLQVLSSTGVTEDEITSYSFDIKNDDSTTTSITLTDFDNPDKNYKFTTDATVVVYS